MPSDLVFHILWPVVVSVPLAAAMLLAVPALRPAIVALAPWTATPALALVVLVPPGVFVDAPWLLLGARLGIDETGRHFLLFTAALWIVSGEYARGWLADDAAKHRFVAFFLATMAGNLGLILAADMATFYLFFALMSFAAYGLVIHDGGEDAHQAGRVYLAFVVAGEILLFIGIVGTAGLAGGLSFAAAREAPVDAPGARLMAGFLLAGFAVKTGAVPLHMWLPLAYRAAPIPAAAVLSGPMIKAGLLGWLRFLPIGEQALPGLGSLCIVVGLISAFWGVLAGVTQRDPKATLGYSSISQMGLITTAVGAGLLAPESWTIVLPAIWIYALHHALAKSALFLGTGIAARVPERAWARGIAAAGLALPALALAGAPLTSGAAAKVALKKSIEAAPIAAAAIEVLLSLAAVGTTLLMARFLVLALPETRQRAAPLAAPTWSGWLALLAGVGLSVWLLPWVRDVARESLAFAHVWTTAWPVAVGTAIALIAWWLPQAGGAAVARLHVPPGDLLWPVLRLLRGMALLWSGGVLPRLIRARNVQSWWADGRPATHLRRVESRLASWNVAGVLILLLAAALFASLAP